MSVRCTGERESVCVCGVSHVCEVHRRERECVWSEPCL